MLIQQAMGTPRSRGTEVVGYLGEFVEDMKSSGFVAEAMARHDIQGALVGPPASA
ncbi:Uncharacterised protein [Xylophilus ampelinus]|nr:Uncharacterised protein [Xylophilus ampelinus]